MPAPSQPVPSTIPRIIHQSWKTADVPERFHEWVVRNTSADAANVSGRLSALRAQRNYSTVVLPECREPVKGAVCLVNVLLCAGFRAAIVWHGGSPVSSGSCAGILEAAAPALGVQALDRCREQVPCSLIDPCDRRLPSPDRSAFSSCVAHHLCQGLGCDALHVRHRQLIAEHYPWFLETYEALPKNIMRADAVRAERTPSVTKAVLATFNAYDVQHMPAPAVRRSQRTSKPARCAHPRGLLLARVLGTIIMTFGRVLQRGGQRLHTCGWAGTQEPQHTRCCPVTRQFPQPGPNPSLNPDPDPDPDPNHNHNPNFNHNPNLNPSPNPNPSPRAHLNPDRDPEPVPWGDTATGEAVLHAPARRHVR